MVNGSLMTTEPAEPRPEALIKHCPRCREGDMRQFYRESRGHHQEGWRCVKCEYWEAVYSREDEGWP